MELIFADLALKRKIPQNAAVLGDPQKLIPQNIMFWSSARKSFMLRFYGFE